MAVALAGRREIEGHALRAANVIEQLTEPHFADRKGWLRLLRILAAFGQKRSRKWTVVARRSRTYLRCAPLPVMRRAEEINTHVGVISDEQHRQAQVLAEHSAALQEQAQRSENLEREVVRLQGKMAAAATPSVSRRDYDGDVGGCLELQPMPPPSAPPRVVTRGA